MLYGADSILDIDAVSTLLHRQLTPTPRVEVEVICNKLQLNHLPTIPKALKYELVIDQRLLDITQFELNSGDENSIIEMDKEHFVQLASDAMFGKIAITEQSLKSASLDTVDDVEGITTAVANFTQLRIKQRLEETLEFPPLPDTAQRIIKLRVDPNGNIQDLSDIVESDPSLAAQVVSWAASPYYAAPG